MHLLPFYSLQFVIDKQIEESYMESYFLIKKKSFNAVLTQL